MRTSNTTAHVHRFHDRVALSLPGKGETVYLTPAEAAQLASLLNAYAHDAERYPFAESTLRGHDLALSNPIRS